MCFYTLSPGGACTLAPESHSRYAGERGRADTARVPTWQRFFADCAQRQPVGQEAGKSFPE